MTQSPDPKLRASDADRERVADLLRRAAGDGQLTIDELDGRLHEAFTVRTRGELASLTTDLQSAGEVAVPGRTGYTIRRGGGGERRLLGIMGTCQRSGRWRLGAGCTVLNIMGSTDLDLNQVELSADRVELRVYSIMGWAEIRLPRGLDVEVSESAFMGTNSIAIAEDGTPAVGPVLHLRIFSLMGGADVERGPRLARAERRALRRRRRDEIGR